MGFCRNCGGDLMLLGVLGFTRHYKCRDCGSQFYDKDAFKDGEENE